MWVRSSFQSHNLVHQGRNSAWDISKKEKSNVYLSWFKRIKLLVHFRPMCSRLQNSWVKLCTWVARFYLAAFYTILTCWPVWGGNGISWNQVFRDSCNNKNAFLVAIGFKSTREKATEYKKEVIFLKKKIYLH